MIDRRLPRLADQLLLVERELRLLGWWEDEPPSDAALASEQPFCVDTLAFGQWLQWVFLPRMKRVIETGGELPEASGVKVMAEVAYRETPVQAAALLQALGAFDALIQGRR